jgi:hypothetical protein
MTAKITNFLQITSQKPPETTDFADSVTFFAESAIFFADSASPE